MDTQIHGVWSLLILLFCSIVCVTAVNLPKCKKGALWDDGCGPCRCHQNGTAICNHDQGCPWGDCRPGNKWFDGCNLCECSGYSDGKTRAECKQPRGSVDKNDLEQFEACNYRLVRVGSGQNKLAVASWILLLLTTTLISDNM